VPYCFTRVIGLLKWRINQMISYGMYSFLRCYQHERRWCHQTTRYIRIKSFFSTNVLFRISSRLYTAPKKSYLKMKSKRHCKPNEVRFVSCFVFNTDLNFFIKHQKMNYAKVIPIDTVRWQIDIQSCWIIQLKTVKKLTYVY
jgi:hypothetical protein